MEAKAAKLGLWSHPTTVPSIVLTDWKEVKIKSRRDNKTLFKFFIYLIFSL